MSLLAKERSKDIQYRLAAASALEVLDGVVLHRDLAELALGHRIRRRRGVLLPRAVRVASVAWDSGDQGHCLEQWNWIDSITPFMAVEVDSDLIYISGTELIHHSLNLS